MTEASHPKTRELSDWAKSDLSKAFAQLKEVDVDALQALSEKAALLGELKSEIDDTLRTGGRVFLSGCGATGRLSLTLEYLWRFLLPMGERNPDRVVGFMAGGDLALIKSIESFEDHPEFGARQLQDLRFHENDLLLGITEGGETSFVIGSVEEAVRISKRKPFFLYCNPDEILVEKVERSRRTIQSKDIRSICLDVGPMALSGSTRMQASTVLLLAVGSCFLISDKMPNEVIGEFKKILEECDFSFLNETVTLEDEAYQAGERVIYSTDEYGMTILTDTTERSPTFSLVPFENFDDSGVDHSLVYFNLLGTRDVESAWQKLLLREPRAIAWDEYVSVAGEQRLNGYDFSDRCFDKRQVSTENRHTQQFSIEKADSGDVVWRFKGFKHTLPMASVHPFYQHLLLKILLNNHSTVLMGRLNRYEGNWMTWVKPSNGKLIDRAARYVLSLGEVWGLSLEYDQVVERIFREADHLKPDEPIVIKVLNSFQSSAN